MAQQVSPFYHRFLKVREGYHSKVTPNGALHATKIAKAVLLYVFRIELPASLFKVGLPRAGPDKAGQGRAGQGRADQT